MNRSPTTVQPSGDFGGALPEPAGPPPATWPREHRASARLLVVDGASGTLLDEAFPRLPALLEPGDLLVVNDAATLPASLWVRTQRGERFELRLAGFDGAAFRAIALGAGDHRDPTEQRGKPPRLVEGARLEVLAGAGSELSAVVRSAAPDAEGVTRKLRVEFDRRGSELWSALYRAGRPIQYSYVERPLSLFHVQNAFAARPFAFELPSAGYAFDWEALLSLRRRGVVVAALTHAAGISSTGSRALDETLPWPETYDLPLATVRAVRAARGAGRRVIAVGTSVVRALESAAAESASYLPEPGRAETRLVIREGFRPRVVSGVLSGIHPPGGSHFELLSAFAPAGLLVSAALAAQRLDYRQHEFGDLCLVWAGRVPGTLAA